MADLEPTESPIEGAGAAGPNATEALALLGNETRLAILLALWERYEPHADGTDGSPDLVAFSELFERVDYDNPGNFRYHLDQLEGRFVRRRTEREGYELRLPGLKLVQAIVAGAGIDDATVDPVEVDQPCPRCGATTTVAYREGLVIQTCTECEGVSPERTDVEGFLNAVKFEPAGVAGRSPEELGAASRLGSLRQLESMFDGLCPTCAGPVEAWLDPCRDHDESGVCERCGTIFAVWARFQCRVCKDHGTVSPKALARFHPAVISLYDDHGISTRLRADDVEGVTRGLELVDSHDIDLVSTEPPEVTVTVEQGDDVVRLTFDRSVAVVDVQR